MRFKDIRGAVLKDEKYAGEYARSEKLFRLRFGEESLFVPGLFSIKAIAYDTLRYAYLETEFVECLTSEFPAEYDVFHLFFCESDDSFAKVAVDSRVKAERLLARLAQKAPHIEIREQKRLQKR